MPIIVGWCWSLSRCYQIPFFPSYHQLATSLSSDKGAFNRYHVCPKKQKVWNVNRLQNRHRGTGREIKQITWLLRSRRFLQWTLCFPAVSFGRVWMSFNFCLKKLAVKNFGGWLEDGRKVMDLVLKRILRMILFFRVGMTQKWRPWRRYLS